MNYILRRTIVWAGLVVAVMGASANDGFYQGAGTTLRPVSNSQMRVVRERLEITALPQPQCYEVLYQGKPVETYWHKKFPDNAEGSLGGIVDCKRQIGGHNLTFMAVFHADAVYQVEALADQDNVQIGFPVPDWTQDLEADEGLAGVGVPGVTGFKTYVDGAQVPKLERHSVEVPCTSVYSKSGFCPAPAFIWASSFKKGRHYELRTVYDFGYDRAGFYKGKNNQMPEGQTLWFDQRKVPEAANGIQGAASAITAIYYLHPIKLWAPPPPEEILVRFEAPRDVPITYLVPNTMGLVCIDSKALYFRWSRALPEGDLRVSFPKAGSIVHSKGYEPMAHDYELDAWLNLMTANAVNESRGQIIAGWKMGCDLFNELKQTLGEKSKLVFWYGKDGKKGILGQCIERCP